MKLKLGVGSLVAAAVMGVISEIGSQIVSQKWDDLAEKKGLPKTLMFGKQEESDEDESDDESDEETE